MQLMCMGPNEEDTFAMGLSVINGKPYRKLRHWKSAIRINKIGFRQTANVLSSRGITSYF